MQVGYSAFGEMIRQARILKGLSQLELAQRLEMTQGTISRAELGRDLRLGTVMEIARALDLEIVLVPRRMVSPIRAILGDGASDKAFEEGETVSSVSPKPARRRRTRVRPKT